MSPQGSLLLSCGSSDGHGRILAAILLWLGSSSRFNHTPSRLFPANADDVDLHRRGTKRTKNMLSLSSLP